MIRLLTFESFVPKNIEKRIKDLEVIQAKELQKFETFVKEFQNNLALLKDKTSIDPQEQLFIDLIKDTEIKIDQQEYPFIILLFHDNKYMFYYDWKSNEFWCHYDRIWSVFKSKFNIEYQIWREFMSDMLEKLFKIRLSTFTLINVGNIPDIEEHFKFRTSASL